MASYREQFLKATADRMKEERAGVLPFESIPIGSYAAPEDFQWSPHEYSARAAYIQDHFKNEPEKELKGGRLAQFIKRLIRKLTRFYVKPLVEEQNDFNENIACAVCMLGDYIRRLPDGDEQERLFTAAQTAVFRQRQQQLELDELSRRLERLERGAGRNG